MCDLGLHLSTKTITKASLILIYPSFATFENPALTNKDSIMGSREDISLTYD